MKKNNRKVMGYIIMIIGILMPLYSLTSITYNELKSSSYFNQYLKYVKEISADKIKILEKNTNDYNNSIEKNNGGNIVDPFVKNEYNSSYNFLNENKDITYGYINIPKIGLSKPILLGATEENLSNGIAHIDGTNLPVGGKGRRSVIAGHRGWYQDVMFLNINELEKDDEIFVITVFGKELKYKVFDKEVIVPYEWEKLKPNRDEDILTLLTCEPISPSAPYRLLVNAKRVDDIKDIDKLDDNNKPSSENKITMFKYILYGTTFILWIIIILIIRKIVKCIKQVNIK